RCAPPRPCQPDRSGPLPADTSAAARAATSCTGMWSTVTAILFFCPQSFAKLSNHLSYSGTKWLHCTIDSDLLSANARDTNGAKSTGAVAAVARVRPVSFKNRRRVTRGRPFVPIVVPPCLFQLDEASPETRALGHRLKALDHYYTARYPRGARAISPQYWDGVASLKCRTNGASPAYGDIARHPDRK